MEGPEQLMSGQQVIVEEALGMLFELGHLWEDSCRQTSANKKLLQPGYVCGLATSVEDP